MLHQPDGFACHDVAVSLICHGTLNKNGKDPYAEEVLKDELMKARFVLPGPLCEFYPDPEHPTFCVLFACQPEGKSKHHSK